MQRDIWLNNKKGNLQKASIFIPEERNSLIGFHREFPAALNFIVLNPSC